MRLPEKKFKIFTAFVMTDQKIINKTRRLKELFETREIFALLDKMRISFVLTGTQVLFKNANALTVYDENKDKYTIICRSGEDNYDLQCRDAAFYAAHELGHIVLGHFSGSLTSVPKIKENERTADFFAEVFLKF